MKIRIKRWTVPALVLILVSTLWAMARTLGSCYEFRIGGEMCSYLYGSRCQCAYAIMEEGTGAVFWHGWNAPEIWHLVRDDGREIPAYTLTAEPVEKVNACSYRAEMLDSDGEEGLATIVRHSFPYISLEELTRKVNETMGAGEIENLTVGEAICGAQQAIWKVWYGDRFASEKRYVSIRGIREFQPSDYLYPESLNHVESVSTGNNIQNLYRYYLELWDGCNTGADREKFADAPYEGSEVCDGSDGVTVLVFLPKEDGPVLIGCVSDERNGTARFKQESDSSEVLLGTDTKPVVHIVNVWEWTNTPQVAFALMVAGLLMVIAGILLGIHCLICMERE